MRNGTLRLSLSVLGSDSRRLLFLTGWLLRQPQCLGDVFCSCAAGILDDDLAAGFKDSAGYPAVQCSILTPFDSTGSSFQIFSTVEST